MYSKGGHGFGMRVQHFPSDTWIERLGDWLRLITYLKLLHPPEWASKLEEWQIEDVNKKEDWQNFARYRKANNAPTATKSTKPRVVFMGNSITDAWINSDSYFFAGKTTLTEALADKQLLKCLYVFVLMLLT